MKLAPLQNKTLLCFDLFHTLVCSRTEGVEGRMTSEILNIPEPDWIRLLFDSSDARLRGVIRDKVEIMRTLAHAYNPDIPESSILEATEFRYEKFRRTLAMKRPEKEQVLRQLRKAGHKLCLVSNADAVEVDAWYSSPLATCFDHTVFSYEAGCVKPEPEIYQHALRFFGASPEQTVFIGDGGSNELKGAKAVGLTTVMTTEITQETWPDKISERSVDADYMISRLDELLSLCGIIKGKEAICPSC